MANVVVVGSQWGDEGKGKIVDWLSERADIVVRFQGGHNAGHTLVVDGKVYKLSLLPSGVVREGKLSIIGNGVVFDPHAFVAEVAKLKAQGIDVTPASLKIAENAALILSLHRELDGFREDAASNSGTRIGTIRRGIGPAYEDKVGRRAIRVMDLASLETLPIKIDRLLSHHNALRRGLGHPEASYDAIHDELTSVANDVLPYMDRVWKLLDDARRAGDRILFEGAQGTLLDIDHGTYPFVTSSNTVAGQAATGAGVGPGVIGFVLGITKHDARRRGPFPTEQDNGRRVPVRAAANSAPSPGTSAVRLVRRGAGAAAVAVNGIEIALTKLDGSTGSTRSRMHRLQPRRRGDRLSAGKRGAGASNPSMRRSGWKGTTAGARSWNDRAQAVNMYATSKN